jgi:hypothetical protein
VSPLLSLSVAVTFVWLGMVLAISFLEAPLKFRVPEVTIRIGLAIGRRVFLALNVTELVMAATLALALAIDAPATGIAASATVAVLVLLAQVVAVRPVLTRRSDRVLAGENAPRSAAHYWYVALEGVKVVALVTTGTLILAS